MEQITLTVNQFATIMIVVCSILALVFCAIGYHSAIKDVWDRQKAEPSPDCLNHNHAYLIPCRNGNVSGPNGQIIPAFHNHPR